LKRSLAEKFDDELKFFKGWIDRPKAVGSIIPTSSVTARKMASVIDPASGLPVLEIGPGTGVITRAILARGVRPENLYALEYSPEFVRHLRRIYPDANVIEGDAFNLSAALGEHNDLMFDTVVSAVPLLNFPVAQRIAYLESLLDRIPPGRPVVQLTYGPLSPIPPGRGDYHVEHFHFVVRNIPPTQLWIYRRGKH
jgi:phosphatidylethanolamine/phosphatidyl-N-methylethanolamine N-methyltransferase